MSEEIDGESCTCMRGVVSLDNNGGFLQLSADLPASQTTDYTRHAGLLLKLRGNAQVYNVHLKTSDLSSPWQSYRQQFTASPRWTAVRLPFADFEPHRTSIPLNLTALKRLVLVAIGRAFEAELCISTICLY